jgi:hypothetical protein
LYRLISNPELPSLPAFGGPDRVKNGEERLLALNRVAMSVIEEVRGEHPEYVFTYRDHPIAAMNNSGWRSARKRAGISLVRVHDLKHIFGRRLRAAGVSYEDGQDLLGTQVRQNHHALVLRIFIGCPWFQMYTDHFTLQARNRFTVRQFENDNRLIFRAFLNHRLVIAFGPSWV